MVADELGSPFPRELLPVCLCVTANILHLWWGFIFVLIQQKHHQQMTVMPAVICCCRAVAWSGSICSSNFKQDIKEPSSALFLSHQTPADHPLSSDPSSILPLSERHPLIRRCHSYLDLDRANFLWMRSDAPWTPPTPPPKKTLMKIPPS